MTRDEILKEAYDFDLPRTKDLHQLITNFAISQIKKREDEIVAELENRKYLGTISEKRLLSFAIQIVKGDE